MSTEQPVITRRRNFRFDFENHIRFDAAASCGVVRRLRNDVSPHNLRWDQHEIRDARCCWRRLYGGGKIIEPRNMRKVACFPYNKLCNECKFFMHVNTKSCPNSVCVHQHLRNLLREPSVAEHVEQPFEQLVPSNVNQTDNDTSQIRNAKNQNSVFQDNVTERVKTKKKSAQNNSLLSQKRMLVNHSVSSDSLNMPFAKQREPKCDSDSSFSDEAIPDNMRLYRDVPFTKRCNRCRLFMHCKCNRCPNVNCRQRSQNQAPSLQVRKKPLRVKFVVESSSDSDVPAKPNFLNFRNSNVDDDCSLSDAVGGEDMRQNAVAPYTKFCIDCKLYMHCDATVCPNTACRKKKRPDEKRTQITTPPKMSRLPCSRLKKQCTECKFYMHTSCKTCPNVRCGMRLSQCKKSVSPVRRKTRKNRRRNTRLKAPVTFSQLHAVPMENLSLLDANAPTPLNKAELLEQIAANIVAMYDPDFSKAEVEFFTNFVADVAKYGLRESSCCVCDRMRNASDIVAMSPKLEKAYKLHYNLQSLGDAPLSICRR